LSDKNDKNNLLCCGVCVGLLTDWDDNASILLATHDIHQHHVI